MYIPTCCVCIGIMLHAHISQDVINFTQNDLGNKFLAGISSFSPY